MNILSTQCGYVLHATLRLNDHCSPNQPFAQRFLRSTTKFRNIVWICNWILIQDIEIPRSLHQATVSKHSNVFTVTPLSSKVRTGEAWCCLPAITRISLLSRLFTFICCSAILATPFPLPVCDPDGLQSAADTEEYDWHTSARHSEAWSESVCCAVNIHLYHLCCNYCWAQ
jgi:hypothetical protein